MRNIIMAGKVTIRKDAYGTGNGGKKFTKNWYVYYTSFTGRRHEIPGFRDKGATVQLGDLVEKLDIALEAGIQPDALLMKSVSALSPKLQENLARRGFIDKTLAMRIRPLTNEIDDWAASLIANRASAKYAKEAPNRVRRIVTDCGFKHINDVTRAAVQSWLHSRRVGVEGESCGMGEETIASYIRAIKAFTNWMVQENRVEASPLKHLKINATTLTAPDNCKGKKKKKRRALHPDQNQVLIDTANASQNVVRNMAGEDRAILYQVALETGLRWSELFSLLIASFDLDGEIPTVTVAAAHSKRRREDVIPLRRALVDKLRSYFHGKSKDQKAFKGMLKDKGAKMLRYDLAKAKIPVVTDEGEIDFHSLRHSYITRIVKAGALPKMAQTLARHSDINLTLGRYTHLELQEQLEALEKTLA